METAMNLSKPQETAASVASRFIPVGPPLAAHLQQKYGVVIPEKTIRSRYMRKPALQVVYFFGKPYTTSQWADDWFFARLRDQPPHGRSRPRPPLVAELRHQFRAEEAEILARLQRAELTERECAGDVWHDAPA
jgi:hypothetical protein